MLRRSVSRLLVLFILFAVPAGAQTIRRHVRLSAPLTPEQQSLWNRYSQAIFDSAVYQSWNLRQLRPLAPDPNGQVLLATLTSESYPVGQPLGSHGYIWVTGVPEVQDLCRAFRGDVRMQLRELIGLPPDEKIPYAVVLQANVSDVFRPSPWPETDTQWPCGTSSAQSVPADCGNAFPKDAGAAHIDWIATADLQLHSIPDGYPWTHLGYTYNWAPNKDRYGASEYVIREDSKYPIMVVSSVSPEQYCAPPAQ